MMPISEALAILKNLVDEVALHFVCNNCGENDTVCTFCGCQSSNPDKLVHFPECLYNEAKSALERIEGYTPLNENRKSYGTTIDLGPYQIAIHVKDFREECIPDSGK